LLWNERLCISNNLKCNYNGINKYACRILVRNTLRK
jgi:hypothetical protein